jgi:hypothetical protein
MDADAPADERIRTAIDAFFGYAERNPAKARVLLFAWRGEPELHGAAEAIQAEATARLAALLAAESEHGRRSSDRELTLQLRMEFVKTGMHGLAEWWQQHPATPRAALVDAIVDVAWSGLRSQLSELGSTG